jgi:hypothetical protein
MAAARRVLTLATESLDMMRGVTGVVKESLDRAEVWVGRMRAVGIQRADGMEGEGAPQAQAEVEGEGEGEEMASEGPTPSSAMSLEAIVGGTGGAGGRGAGRMDVDEV